jgi:hypothetical protein
VAISIAMRATKLLWHGFNIRRLLRQQARREAPDLHSIKEQALPDLQEPAIAPRELRYPRCAVASVSRCVERR